ncbi:MAG: sensor histidine kinase [Acidothermaceae bacterium]
MAGLPVGDLVIAGVLCVLGVASAATRHPPEGALTVTVPTALVMTVALAWRSRAPLASLVVVLVAGDAQTLASKSPGSLWAFACYLLVAYSVAAKTSSEGRAAVGGSLVVVALWLQEMHDHGADYLFIVIVFGGVWLLGRAVRQWQARATSAERNQDDRAIEAVADERARIARELHDLVAHGVSVIAIQADAAEAALDHDPELAREPLRAIKTSSREALDEMRRLLALLRIDDQAGPRRPQPGLGELDGLVDSVQRAGLPVRVVIDGTADHLPPGVDLAAFRVVQEGLTNVLKHAGAVPTRVSVRYALDAVTVQVSNDKPSGHRPSSPRVGGGHGLVGLRERAAIVGGELVAGPDPNGGFTVRARLPRSAAHL